MKKYSNLILLVSFVINIFLIGWLAGQWSGDKVRDQHPVRHKPDWSQEEVTLPKDKAQLLQQKMRQVKQEKRGAHRKIKQIRQEIIVILTAEEFDKKMYTEKTEELHQLHEKMMRGMANMVKDMADDLSQEERKALAQQLKKRGPRGDSPERGKRNGRRPPPHMERGEFNDRRPPPRQHHDGPLPF